MDGFGRHVLLSDLTKLGRVCLTPPELSSQEVHGTVHFGLDSKKELLYCQGDGELGQAVDSIGSRVSFYGDIKN